MQQGDLWWCNSLGSVPMAPIQMAEVQKAAPPVTPDGADADAAALLPIAALTLCTMLTVRRSLYQQSTFHMHTVHSLHRSHYNASILTDHYTIHMLRCMDQITHSALFTL